MMWSGGCRYVHIFYKKALIILRLKFPFYFQQERKKKHFPA